MRATWHRAANKTRAAQIQNHLPSFQLLTRNTNNRSTDNSSNPQTLNNLHRTWKSLNFLATSVLTAVFVFIARFSFGSIRRKSISVAAAFGPSERLHSKQTTHPPLSTAFPDPNQHPPYVASFENSQLNTILTDDNLN